MHVASSFEKKPTQLRVSSAYSKVKRCVTFIRAVFHFVTFRSVVFIILIKPFATLGIHVSSVVEEKPTQLCVSFRNSKLQQCIKFTLVCRLHHLVLCKGSDDVSMKYRYCSF
eukprot:Rhum_TRINITY_DN15214_c1_g1::Rhum_TRINITY_DN15214_c1_g1_i10::g.144591::m.144591